MTENKAALARAKQILKARGLTPNDYTHLSYEAILKLAGIPTNG